MREILKMLAVLTALCAVAGFSLSYLQQSTKLIIENTVLKEVQQPAIISIFDKVDKDPVAERKTFTTTSGEVIVFPYLYDGALVGVAIEGSGNGFGGRLGMMVGFDMEKGVLLGAQPTSMQETAGIGTMITLPKFTKQFPGSGLDLALRGEGGKLDAISGATISSEAAIVAVKNAVAKFGELKPQIAETWK